MRSRSARRIGARRSRGCRPGAPPRRRTRRASRGARRRPLAQRLGERDQHRDGGSGCRSRRARPGCARCRRTRAAPAHSAARQPSRRAGRCGRRARQRRAAEHRPPERQRGVDALDDRRGTSSISRAGSLVEDRRRSARRRGGRARRGSGSASGSPVSATTFHVGSLGPAARRTARPVRDVVGDQRRRPRPATAPARRPRLSPPPSPRPLRRRERGITAAKPSRNALVHAPQRPRREPLGDPVRRLALAVGAGAPLSGASASTTSLSVAWSTSGRGYATRLISGPRRPPRLPYGTGTTRTPRQRARENETRGQKSGSRRTAGPAGEVGQDDRHHGDEPSTRLR